MRNLPGWWRGALLGLTALVALAEAPARAQQPLDVVLVVDVSRSMFTQSPAQGGDGANDIPDGSDPQRLRWDAVQLVLNLLSAEDRVMIVAFNDKAPAFANGQWVPGDLFQQFAPIDENRQALRTLVESFIHDRGGPLPNTDDGKTAILLALQKAAELSQREPQPGRSLVAVLLTDGKESEGQTVAAKALDDRALASALGPWARRDRDRERAVYTIGLGKLVDADYLRRIAVLCGGDFTPVERNGQILETFRNLIWQLKKSWIKTIDLSTQRSTDDTMRGVVDLGILAYAERTGNAGPRNTELPRTRPSLRWEGDPAGTLQPEERSGKGGTGYLYTYYGRRTRNEPSPFKDFASQALRLATTWPLPPSEPVHRLSYAKRTARPLLELTEPRSFQDLPRHQPLTVRVALSDLAYFKADQFRLELQIRPQGDGSAGAARPGVTVALAPDSDAKSFVGKLELDRLPRGPGEKDYYTFRVLAEGLPGPENALAFYHLELPPKTVSVDNRVVLAANPARVVLSGDAVRQRVKVSSRARIQGDLPLSVSLTRPKSARGRVSDEALTIRQVDPAGGGDGAVVLHDGEATLELVVDKAKVDPGIVYEDGSLEVAVAGGGGGPTGLKVPVGLRIDLVQLASGPTALEVEDGKLSAPIVIEAQPPGPPPGARTVRVALAALGDGVKFSPEELWVERASGGAGAPHARELEVGLGEAFRIGFQPKPGKERRGRHAYVWTATAPPWANPVSGNLTLTYNPPKLAGPTAPVVVRVAHGAQRAAAIHFALEGLEGETSRVVFRPDQTERGRPVFTCVNGPATGRATTAIDLDLPSSDDAVDVAGGPAGADLRLRVRVPEDRDQLPVGHYRIRGALAGVNNDAREAPAEVLVVVNDLEVLLPPRGDAKAWTPAPRVDVNTFFDRERDVVLRVRTGLRDPLQPGDLSVTPIRTLENDDGDRILEPPALLGDPAVRSVGDGQELEVTLRFPPTHNGDSSKKYRMAIHFRHARLEVERMLEFVMEFLDGRSLDK